MQRAFLCILLLASLCGGSNMSLAEESPAPTAESWEQVDLPNGSFELGENLPTGWRALQGNQREPSTGSVLVWDHEQARTGEKSVYIRRGANGPLRWSTSTAIPVEPGVRYQYRAWFRVNPSNAGAVSIGLQSRRPQPATGRLWETSQLAEVTQDTQGQWQPVVLEFTPPEGVDQLWLRLADQTRWPPRSGEGVEIWFDDASLWRQTQPQEKQ